MWDSRLPRLSVFYRCKSNAFSAMNYFCKPKGKDTNNGEKFLCTVHKVMNGEIWEKGAADLALNILFHFGTPEIAI